MRRGHLSIRVVISAAAILAASVSGSCSKCGGVAAVEASSGPPPAGPQAGPAHVDVPPADRIPVDVQRIGSEAARLFDAAYASDWASAADAINTITQAERSLPPRFTDADLADRLGGRIGAARDDVGSRNRAATMDDANRITRAVADIAAKYQSGVTAAPMLLAYYGRQLEIGVASNDPAMLRRATSDLKSIWRDVQPRLRERGDTEDDRRFTDVIVSLDGARRPGDYVAPARAELTEADRIAKVLNQ